MQSYLIQIANKLKKTLFECLNPTADSPTGVQFRSLTATRINLNISAHVLQEHDTENSNLRDPGHQTNETRGETDENGVWIERVDKNYRQQSSESAVEGHHG